MTSEELLICITIATGLAYAFAGIIFYISQGKIMTFENYIIENYTVADLCASRPASEGFTHSGLSRICEEAESRGLAESDFSLDEILSGLCAKWRASFTPDNRENYTCIFW